MPYGAAASTSWAVAPEKVVLSHRLCSVKVMKMDKKDSKIIEMLKENCRMPAKEISRRTGIPITTVCNRVKALEKSGIIKKYQAVVDNTKLGKGIEAFVRIDMKKDPDEIVSQFANRPEVEECYVVSGSIEVWMKVAMPSVADLHRFVASLKSKNINKVSTQVILRNVDKAKAPAFMG